MSAPGRPPAGREDPSAGPFAGPFAGQVAMVTGAGAGIGLACARRLAASGARLLVLDRNADRVAAVVDELTGGRAGVEVEAVVTDAASEAGVADGVARATARWGRLDVLVTCAGGFAEARPLHEVPPREWEDTVSANLTATFLACRAVVPVMRAQRYGRIVTVASMAARTALRQSTSPYSAGKAAVLGLTRQLALEVAADGVTVNAVAPGVVLSPRVRRRGPEVLERLAAEVPVGRLGRPEEVAAAVCFLAGPDASYVTGATLDVNGGRFIG
jgi:3-oxoacyl-[acyl-carrier protein] reductase